MGGDGDGSKVETHQNFGDSDVFTKDKRVNEFPCYLSNPLIQTTSKTHINYNISIFNNITTSL